MTKERDSLLAQVDELMQSKKQAATEARRYKRERDEQRAEWELAECGRIRQQQTQLSTWESQKRILEEELEKMKQQKEKDEIERENKEEETKQLRCDVERLSTELKDALSAIELQSSGGENENIREDANVEKEFREKIEERDETIRSCKQQIQR